jgi:8-oxo-dGTP diphosphatase
MESSRQILPAVAAAIFNEKGEVLLQRRKDVNKWCIISGHVEFGETIEAAILREIEEEINLKASIVRFIGVYSSPESQTYIYSDKRVQYVTSYFEAKLSGSIPDNFSNNETQELRFFDPKDIPDEMALINAYWLNDAMNKSDGVFLR